MPEDKARNSSMTNMSELIDLSQGPYAFQRAVHEHDCQSDEQVQRPACLARYIA